MPDAGACSDLLWPKTISSELRHHAASHAQNDSKKLKYDQMVASRDAVVTAQQLSAAMLRSNMQLHDSPTKTIPAEHMSSFQHQVEPEKNCVLLCLQKVVCPTTQGI